MSVKCTDCKVYLFSLADVCFYSKTDGSITLMVKPEQSALVQASTVSIEAEKNYFRAKCKACHSNLGCHVPYGPNGALYIALGTEKVIVNEMVLKRKDKWRDQVSISPFSDISIRDDTNFYGMSDMAHSSTMKVVRERSYVPLKHARDDSDFEWKDLLLGRQPRMAQVQAYIETLLRDCIVVMPTGFGKTLVASMVMGRYVAMNPERIAVMVVDRIPLVFQQTKAIENDTGLRVASLCSENKTRRSVKAILEGEFHALVVTAGSLVELIKADRLYADFFSVVVFDECHHCTGNHAYVQLLRELRTSFTSTRPRFLGLTASPFPAKCFPTAQKNMIELKSEFDAVIFKPSLPSSHQKVIWRIIDWSPGQQQFISAVKAFIKVRAGHVNQMAGSERISLIDIEMENFPKILGQLRLASDDFRDEKLRDVCGQLFTLLAALELCDVVGVPTAFDALVAASVTVPGAVRSTGESPRLMQLVREIKMAADDAKILVFVSTRETVRVLCDVLQKKFPKLNPLRVVGHGGYDGMDWDREQEEAINSFSEGRSRLLVCTEEGLDVSACDLVIRFYGSSSLIQSIQSRGRARKAGAQLVTILSQEHKHRVAELEAQERIMDSVIDNAAVMDGLPSKRSRDLLETAQIRDPTNVIAGSTTFEDTKLPIDFRAFSLQLYVDGEITHIEEGRIQRLLADEFEVYAHMKIYRIHCMNRNAARLHPSARVFKQTDSAVLLSVTPQQGQHEFRNCLQELTMKWNFKLRDRAVWIDMPYPTNPNANMKAIALHDISAGYLLSKTEFDERISWPCETASFNKDVIEVTISGWKRMRIAVSSLNSCGILSVDGRTGSCSLFLPLSSAPVVEILEDDNKWKRVIRGDEENQELCTLCAYPVLCLRVSNDLQTLFSNLINHSLGIPVFIGRVTHFHGTDSIDEHIHSSPPISANVKWSLGIVASDWSLIISPQAIKDLKQAALTVPPDIAAGILDQLHFLATTSGSIWDSLAGMFNALKVSFRNMSPAQRNRQNTAPRDYISIICSLLAAQLKMKASVFEALIRPFLVKPTQLQTLDIPLPYNYDLLPSVVVTPTRVILTPHVISQQSRFLRRFSDKRILVVRFREEQLQDLHDKLALRRVERLLSSGLTVLGETVWFVCASQSQLRNSSAYFAACTQSDAEDIQRDLLPMRPVDTAKVMRILGLFCSSDIPVCTLDQAFMGRIPDIRNFHGSLLTDGSGLCNANITEELKRTAHSPNSVAFQIRYRGAKGVVVYSPQLPNDHPTLLLRPSMIKCESDDMSLCLVKAAKFTRLRLNREIITLLQSARCTQNSVEFDVSEAVTEIQEHELDLLVKMLYDRTEAERRLSGMLDASWIAAASVAGVDICTEPFWARLLRVVYKRAVRSLRSKTHLPVEKACMLMGVPDPEGVLGEDEISIRFTRPDSDIVEIITGPVLMYRNPCLHQGDIRVATAVDRPQLAFLINVVVLPAKKDVPSLAAACSGGDLDGDMFSLIWDERLVPPKCSVFASLDYDKLATEATAAAPLDDRACSLAVFYTKVMANDLLGRVAHLHLALCDLLPDGAKDPLALELAKSQSLAVDFPKTGVAPEVPEQALKLIDHNGFPDFMEKPQNISRLSEKLLGSLFRRCLSLSADTLDLIETFTVQLPQRTDPDVQEAECLYAMYVVAMRRLMSRFGLKSEAEVVLGEAVHWHPLHSANRGKASVALKISWEAIRRFFREEFSSGGNPLEKARTWYKVAYSKQPRSQAFLSFAWLPGNMDFMSSVPRTLSVYSIVGGSALKYYLSTISARRITILGLLETFEKIKEELGDQFEVSLFGSAALFLCDADSDIDIFVQPQLSWESEGLERLSAKERQKHFLELLIPSLDTLGRTIRRVYNTPTPVIKCTVLVEELETNVDFSVCADGISKAKFIIAQYRARPEVLPVFTLIFEWAKACGVLRSSGIGSECILCGGELHAIILKTFNMNAPYSQLQGPLLYDDFCSAAVDGETIGSMIFFFFKECANFRDDFEFVWPVESSPRHFILAVKCTQLATECRRMLHAIAVASTWKEAVEYCSLKAKADSPMEQLLSRSLSYHLESAIEFHSSRLSLVSGAKVSLQMKDTRVLVLANGSRLQLRKLREELRRLLRVGHSIGHLRHRVSAYFMEGSTSLFMFGMASTNGSLKFEVYKEGCQRIHAFHERSQVVPSHGNGSEHEQSSWTRYFIFDFQKRSFLQLEALRGHPNASTLWMSVHFGNFYVMNAVAAVSGRLGALSLGELETAISANRRSRRRLEERFAWDQDDVNRQRDNRDMEKTTISTPGGEVTLSKEDNISCRRKVRNRKISSSFYPCVAVRTPFAERMEVVEQFLLRFGFVPHIDTDTAENHHLKVKYKVDMIASNSFVVEVKLDSNLRLITIGEKPLQWVHCTLLRGSQVSRPDIRLKISTTSEVTESSDLFRFAFPKGTNEPPISVDPASGFVQPSLALPLNVRERVHFVRQIDRKQQFVIDGGVVASIACGVHYSGRLLEHSEPFCDLSLEIRPIPLREWCSFNETDAALSRWMTKVLSIVFAVSESISALRL